MAANLRKSRASVKPMVGTGNERKVLFLYPQEVKQCCTDVWRMDEKGPISLKDVAGCDSNGRVIADKY